MTKKERYKLFRQIMWDYHFPPEEIDAVLKGTKDKVGHFTRQTLFVRLLESYSWFTILELFSLSEIKELLTDETVKKIWPRSLRSKYEYLQKRLQQIVPITE